MLLRKIFFARTMLFNVSVSISRILRRYRDQLISATHLQEKSASRQKPAQACYAIETTQQEQLSLFLQAKISTA